MNYDLYSHCHEYLISRSATWARWILAGEISGAKTMFKVKQTREKEINFALIQTYFLWHALPYQTN